MKLESAELARKAQLRSQPNSVQIAQTVTRYWVYPGTSKDSRDIIFIHGYRGNHRGLEAIAGALEDFNVIIPDLPGFGESTEFPGTHSIDAYANWLSEFIQKLNLKNKPILLGHSFGSIVCSSFAAEHSNQIEMLILENPVSAPALKGPNALITKIAQAFFALAGALPLARGEWLLKSWPMVRGMSIIMTKSWNRELRKWIHAQHDANFNDFASRRVAIEGYTASISNNVGDFAAEFKVPTLLIIGDKDDITTPKQQFQMAQKISVQHAISHHMAVGHLTHYEMPSEVAEDIRQFVNQQEMGPN
jgi:pimeloyl-ACP methyl ester carboxylesterase